MKMFAKTIRSASAFLLVAALFLGVCGSPIALALESLPEDIIAGLDKDGNEKINYVALGDSMTNGYGHAGYYLVLQKHLAENHDENTDLCKDPSQQGNGLDEGSPSGGCPFFYGDYAEDTRYMDWGNNYGYLSNAPEAYPTKLAGMLAEATGKTVNQLNMAISGMRAEELRFILDPSYIGDGYTGKFFRNDASITGSSEARLHNARQNALNPWNYDLNNSPSHQYLRDLGNLFGSTYYLPGCKYEPELYVDYPALGLGAGNAEQLAAIALVRTEYKYALTNAELITIALGTNNFGTGVQSAMYRAIESAFGVTLGDTTDFKYDINTVLAEFPELADVYPQVTQFIYNTVMNMPEIVGMFETEEDADKAVKDIVATYSYGLLGFIANYKESLELIRKLNPDAPIVVVGAMNIEEGIHFVVGDKTINFGDLYGTIVDAGNAWLAGYVADMDNVFYSETEDLSLIVDEIAEGNWNSNMLSLMAADFAWNSDRGGDMAMRLRSIRALNTFGIHNEAVLKVVEAYLANPEDAAAVAAMNAEAQKMVDRYDAFGDLPTAGSYHVDITLDEAILALQDYYIAMHLLSAMEEAAKDPYINMDSVVTWFKDNGFKAIFTNIDLLDDDGIQDLLYFYTRMMFANGAGVHPSVKGHENIASDIFNALETGRSGAEDAEKKENELKEQAKGALKAYLKANYPTVYKMMYESESVAADMDDLALIIKMLKMSDNAALKGVDLDELETDLREANRRFEESKTPEEQAAAQEDVRELSKKLWALAVKVSGTKYEVTEDSFYVSFGDSNVNGIGLDGYKETNNLENNLNGIGQYIEDSAPALLAKELFGENWKEHFAPYAQGGIRVEDLYLILGGEIEADQYFNERVSTILLKGTVEATREDYIATLKKADLISFVIGGGNVTTFVGYQIEKAAAGEALSAMDWAAIGYTQSEIAEIKEFLEMAVPMADMLGLMDKYVPEDMEIENPALFASVLIESMLYGYASYNYYYPLVLDQIRAINPDAQLLILGMFNPVDDWNTTITVDGEEKFINIGGIASNLIDAANLQSLAFALTNDNTSFVDIRDTVTFLDAEYAGKDAPTFGEYYDAVMTENGKMVHADEEGHKFIFNQMLTAISGEGSEYETVDLLEEFYGVLNDEYLTDSEKLDLLGDIYSVLKAEGELGKYSELAIVEEIYDYLNDNSYIKDNQTLAIVLDVYGKLLYDINGDIDNELTKYEQSAIVDNVYKTLFFAEGIDNEDRIAIIGNVYAILDNAGKLYKYDLEDIEELCKDLVGNGYVTDAQAFAIVDKAYNLATDNDGFTDAEQEEFVKFVYELIRENDAEKRVYVFGKVYTLIKGELTETENLAVIEALYAYLDSENYISAQQSVDIVDFVYDRIIDGELTADEKTAIADYIYETLFKADITDEDRIAIIGNVYAILDNHNYVSAANAKYAEAVENIYNALTEAELLTNAQAMDIVDFVFVTVMANNGNVDAKGMRTIAIYIYDVLLNGESSPAAYARGGSGSGLTPEEKLQAIFIVYEELKASDIVNAESYPQLETLEELADELIFNDDALLTPEQSMAIIDAAFNTLVVEEKPASEAVEVLTEVVTEEVFDNPDVDPMVKLEVIDKIGAVVGELVTPEGGSGSETEDPMVNIAEYTKYIGIAKQIVANLKAEGLFDDHADEQFNALISAVLGILVKGEQIDIATLAETAYSMLFNQPDLTLEEKIRIVVVIYKTLEEESYLIPGFTFFDDVNAFVGETEALVEELKTIVLENEAVVRELYANLEVMNAEVEALVAELGEKLVALDKLENEVLAGLKADRAALVAELEALEAKLEAVVNGTYGRAAASDKEALIADTEAAIAETKAAIAELDATIAYVVNQIKTDKSGIEAIKADIAEIKANITATESALAEVVEALEQLKADLEVLANAAAVLYEVSVGQFVDEKEVIEAIVTIAETVPSIIENAEKLYNLGVKVAEKVEAVVSVINENIDTINAMVEALYASTEEWVGVNVEKAEAIAATLEAIKAKLEAFVNVNYPKAETAVVDTVNKLNAALEAYVNEDVLPLWENYQEYVFIAVGAVYLYCEEKGYIDSAEQLVNGYIEDAYELLDKFEAEYEKAKPEIEAAIAELKAKLPVWKADLMALKADLLAAVDAEKAAVIEKAIAELEAKIEAAEKVVAELEAFVAEVEAHLAEVEAAVEAVKEALNAVDGDLVALNEALMNLVDALKKLGCSVAELGEDVISEVEKLIGYGEMIYEDVVAVIETLCVYDELAERFAALLVNEIIPELIEELKEAVEQIIYDATHGEYVIENDSFYVALGDSSAVSQSYVDALAAVLGVDYENLAQAGHTTTDTLKLIAEKAELLAKADLVTVGYTANIFTAEVVYTINDIMMGNEVVEYDWAALVTEDGVEYVEKALAEVHAKLVEQGMDVDFQGRNLADMLVACVEAYAYRYVEHVLTYPEIVNAIHNVAPEALVVIVGLHNTVENIVIDVEGTEVALGEYVQYAVDAANVVSLVNAILVEDTIFVATPDVETLKEEKGDALNYDMVGFVWEMLLTDGADFATSANGHAYIAEQILNALTVIDNRTGLLGDADGDGDVDSTDAMLVLQYDALLIDKDQLNLVVCDVDGDGDVDSTDAMYILQYDGLLIEVFPVEE
ncbi:MAG: hypothetical protein E7674_03330 [Ruminococcaceae bacterium]|nr:hypothetical protein [Oscillospiraceae bacterium]